MTKLPDVLFQKTSDAQLTLHLTRNISLYKFPGKMTPAEMTGSLKTILETLKSYTFFPAEELTPLDKELLFEHFECERSFQEARQGQGFAINPEGTCLIILHENDHIQLQFVSSDSDLTRAWQALSQIDDPLGKAHPYAFSSRFGYLTSNPMLSGTALEARLFLHLPALIHLGLLPELLTTYKDEQISFTSLEGSSHDFLGDILILKNHYTQGVSEETILGLLQTTALKIAAAEQKARSDLKSKPSPALKDFVGRSFGLIMHSYQIDPKEALSGLSGLKLGAFLGWITGTTPEKISALISKERRGHLTHLLNLPASDELSHKRAEWLHEELKGITLIE